MPGDIAFVRVLGPIQVVTTSGLALDLPSASQRRLLARLAEVLAKRAGAPPIHLAAQIAQQYNLGGMLAEARRWAITAGDYTAGQLSPAEAARWYWTAALARGCGATAIVAQAALATDRGFLRLGSAAPAQVALVESALEVADADPATRVRLLALLAEDLVSDVAGTRRIGLAREAIGLAREAIALADASPDPALLPRICSSVLYALWGPDFEATRLRADVANRSIAAAAAAGDLYLEFAVHAAAYTVAIQLADPAGAARSLGRLHAIADVIGAPQMTWTVGWFEAFVATMQARFGHPGLPRRVAGRASTSRVTRSTSERLSNELRRHPPVQGRNQAAVRSIGRGCAPD
jgi:hypothetical protein